MFNTLEIQIQIYQVFFFDFFSEIAFREKSKKPTNYGQDKITEAGIKEKVKG